MVKRGNVKRRCQTISKYNKECILQIATQATYQNLIQIKTKKKKKIVNQKVKTDNVSDSSTDTTDVHMER